MSPCDYRRAPDPDLLALLRVAKRALGFYANPKNWGNDDWGVKAICAEYGESGKKARKALARIDAKLQELT